MSNEKTEALKLCVPLLERFLDLNKDAQTRLTGWQADICFNTTMEIAAALVKAKAALGLDLIEQTEHYDEESKSYVKSSN
jgi:hypothetical protein